MEFFHKAKAVRIRSPQHEKYLVAQEDQESVKQDRNGRSKQARWTVEFVPGSNSIIRLRSCYDKYLTALNQPFLIGLTGRQVLQTLPSRLDSPVEWEPIKCGNHIRLRSRHGHSFLRANGRVPPWRNTVTHFTANETPNSDLEWHVDILETHEGTTSSHIRPPLPPHVHVNGNAPAPASGQGSNAFMQYAMLGVSAGNLGVGLTNLMSQNANSQGDVAANLDATRVSDATEVAGNGNGVYGDATGVAGDATGVSGDAAGVADAFTTTAGGVDVGGLGDLMNSASNCPVM